jgi:hypothetical protein
MCVGLGGGGGFFFGGLVEMEEVGREYYGVFMLVFRWDVVKGRVE